MSRNQPTLREAEARVASILRLIDHAQEVTPAASEPAEEATRWRTSSLEQADGWWIRLPRHRHFFVQRWPISRVHKRCDDCGGILLDRRDCGGFGFHYDPRWLSGDPARRNPTLDGWDKGKWVCLSCFNRVRHSLKIAQGANETRLMIGRIQREIRHAA